MSKTATNTIAKTIEDLDRVFYKSPHDIANEILDDLRQAGFTITPTIIENKRVPADIARPSDTIPWVRDCHLCDSFRKEAEAHAGLITWVTAVAKHFDQHHDIDLIQDESAPALV